MKKIRRNQWIDGVIYNGKNLLLVEKVPREKDAPFPEATIFVCDGKYLQVGEMCDESYVGRFVMGHEPAMYWRNYGKYFDLEKVRVITCFPKYLKEGESNSGLQEVGYELARYIERHNITGKVLLAGHSKGGLIMYVAGNELDLAKKAERKITVVTISSPFEGTDFASEERFEERNKKFAWLMNLIRRNYFERNPGNADVAYKSEFLENLVPLSRDVNHVAFISSIDKYDHPKWTLKDYIQVFMNYCCSVNGDGISSLYSQSHWPKDRKPEVVIVVASTHTDAFDMVLNDFGMQMGSDMFFSDFDEVGRGSLDAFLGEIFRDK